MKRPRPLSRLLSVLRSIRFCDYADADAPWEVGPPPSGPPPRVQTRPAAMVRPLLTWVINDNGTIEALSTVCDDGMPRLYVIELTTTGLRLSGTPALCGGDEEWDHRTDSLDDAKLEAERIERRNRRAVAAEAGRGRA